MASGLVDSFVDLQRQINYSLDSVSVQFDDKILLGRGGGLIAPTQAIQQSSIPSVAGHEDSKTLLFNPCAYEEEGGSKFEIYRYPEDTLRKLPVHPWTVNRTIIVL